MDQVNINDYLPLVRNVATRLANRLPRTVELDDLIGAGVLGLLSAVRQYDKSKGVPFDRYAEIRVRGAILDELRNLDHSSRTMRRQASEMAEVTRSLASALGRAPTSEEIAAELGVTLTRYFEIAAKLSPVSVIGFDDIGIVGDEEKREVMQFLRDPSSTDPQAESAFREAAKIVAEAIEKLTDRQRQVITLYYYEGLSFKEIADLLCLTEGRISQLHSAAIEKLKTLLRDDISC